MKWSSLGIAASLSGLVLVSGSLLARASSPLAAAGKAYRSPAQIGQGALQIRQAPSAQQATSLSASSVHRQPSALRSLATRTAGQPAETGQSGKMTRSATGYAGSASSSSQRSTVAPGPVPLGKSLRRPAGSGSSGAQVSTTGRIRLQSAGVNKLGPQRSVETGAHKIFAGKNKAAAKKLAAEKKAGAVKKVAAEKKTTSKKTGSKKPVANETASKPASSGKGKPAGTNGEPVPKGMITTDEDGNEHFDGTIDEQMAMAEGGRYEWTDADGNEHVTTVTPEGTTREYTSADGMVASSEFAPHERREEVPGADGGGAGVVDEVINRVIPFIPGVGTFGGGYYDGRYYGPGYYDAGYYDAGYAVAEGPEYAFPAAGGYASPAAGVELIPEAPAGASDQGETRFTRRLLHVTNTTDEPITVYIQFRALDESGAWVWLPANPEASQDALTFQLAAGQAGYLEHNGAPISASRARVWAESGARQWTAHRTDDLWLVSEVDTSGQRAYFAAEMETFPFTFD